MMTLNLAVTVHVSRPLDVLLLNHSGDKFRSVKQSENPNSDPDPQSVIISSSTTSKNPRKDPSVGFRVIHSRDAISVSNVWSRLRVC